MRSIRSPRQAKAAAKAKTTGRAATGARAKAKAKASTACSPKEKEARPARILFLRASVCAAPTLNAAGQSRVTASLR